MILIMYSMSVKGVGLMMMAMIWTVLMMVKIDNGDDDIDGYDNNDDGDDDDDGGNDNTDKAGQRRVCNDGT